MNYTIRILLSLFIVASIFLILTSLQEKRYDTITALLALIISIISAWIAYETFNRYRDEMKPILTLRPDLESRYGLFQLVLSNEGAKPAYKVKVIWNTDIHDLDGDIITFNKFNQEYDAIVLNKNEKVYTLVDSTNYFFEKNKNKSLVFSGSILYSPTHTSSKKIKTSFHFSLEHLSRKLTYVQEEPKTNFKLQQIPDKLDLIKVAIEKIKK